MPWSTLYLYLDGLEPEECSRRVADLSNCRVIDTCQVPADLFVARGKFEGTQHDCDHGF